MVGGDRRSPPPIWGERSGGGKAKEGASSGGNKEGLRSGGGGAHGGDASALARGRQAGLAAHEDGRRLLDSAQEVLGKSSAPIGTEPSGSQATISRATSGILETARGDVSGKVRTLMEHFTKPPTDAFSATREKDLLWTSTALGLQLTGPAEVSTGGTAAMELDTIGRTCSSAGTTFTYNPTMMDCSIGSSSRAAEWASSSFMQEENPEDTAMTEFHEAAHSTQGACRIAPTIADVEISLQRAATSKYQNSLYDNADEHTHLRALGKPQTDQPIQQTHNSINIVSMNAKAPLGNKLNAWTKPSYEKFDTIEPMAEILGEGGAIKMDRNATAANINKLDKALVGKLFGRKFPFHFLKLELHKRWSQWGEFQLILAGEDCFICIFETIEARDCILRGGPWFIAGQLISMDKWSPQFSPKSL